jgi:amino acid permease
MMVFVCILLVIIVLLLFTGFMFVLNILSSINDNLVQSTAILKHTLTQSVRILNRKVNSYSYGDSHD